MSEDSRLNEGRSITSSSFAISPDGYLVAAVCDEGKSISIYNTGLLYELFFLYFIPLLIIFPT